METTSRLDFTTGWEPQPSVGFTPTIPQEGQQERGWVDISYWKSLMLILFTLLCLYIVIVFITFLNVIALLDSKGTLFFLYFFLV